MLIVGNYTGLQSALRLCTAPKSPDEDTNLLTAIVTGYIVNAQNDFAVFKYPFTQTINASLAAPDPLSAIGAAMDLYNTVNQAKCVDWNSISRLKGPFNYIRCTQYPYPGAYSGASSIWGKVISKGFSMSHVRDWECQQAFNISSIAGGVALQKALKIDQATIVNTSRILITEGLTDPTTAVGPDSWLPSGDRNHSRIMWIGQSAHGEVDRRSATTDRTALQEARVYVTNSMKGWLGMT